MGKKRPEVQITVINRNKYGEIFDPANYVVPYKGNEHIYAWFEDYARRHMNDKSNVSV